MHWIWVLNTLCAAGFSYQIFLQIRIANRKLQGRALSLRAGLDFYRGGNNSYTFFYLFKHHNTVCSGYKILIAIDLVIRLDSKSQSSHGPSCYESLFDPLSVLICDIRCTAVHLGTYDDCLLAGRSIHHNAGPPHPQSVSQSPVPIAAVYTSLRHPIPCDLFS